jgi:hypothetical protein
MVTGDGCLLQGLVVLVLLVLAGTDFRGERETRVGSRKVDRTKGVDRD